MQPFPARCRLGRRPSLSRHLAWLAALALPLLACGDGGSDPPVDTCSTGPIVRAGLPAEEPPPGGELLAITYNVAGLPEQLSGLMPLQHMPIIGELLNGYDLVLMQESWLTPDPNPFEEQGLRTYHEILHDASQHFFRSVPKPAPAGMDPFRPSALVSDGLNRFADDPFGPVRRDPWETCHESAADCLALKGFSVARHQLAEDVYVDVYNLHMEAGSEPEDVAARAAGVEQLLETIEARGDCVPILMGGDFNLHTERVDEPEDALQYERLLAGAGLTDVCDALACPDPGRIDKWAFRSGDVVTIEALERSVPADTFQDGDGLPLSDHDPVVVRFAWELRP